MKSGIENIRKELNDHMYDAVGLWSSRIQLSDITRALWEQSENYEDFVEALLKFDYPDLKHDERARWIYAKFSKKNSQHWYRIRERFGDKCFKTWSDVGSLLVNNNTLIANHFGDGETRVAVFNKNDLDYEGYAFFADMMDSCDVMFDGEIDIYNYDIIGEGQICKTIEGRYDVYVYQGLIAFVEM